MGDVGEEFEESCEDELLDLLMLPLLRFVYRWGDFNVFGGVA